MFRRTLSHIGTDKCPFKVVLIPQEMTIHADEAFQFKLVVKRGNSSRQELGPVDCKASEDDEDIQAVTFSSEEVVIEASFFVDKGVPQSKLLQISVMKLLPNRKTVIIATGEIDLIQNFGDDFETSSIQMEPTKDGKGYACKTLKYTAKISATKKKD